ncbi:MAG: SUMF1/EgtB/PvdO family nonheme iron enzyme [Planctomycetota bacterium]
MKRIILAAVLVLFLSGKATSAGEKYAFLVGISGYDEKQLKQLPYARADIIEFRDVLLQSGFRPENVVMLVDDLSALPKGGPAGRFLPEQKKIREELRILLPALEEEDELIIGLAGHGVQFKDETDPFFCPLDADLSDKSTLISLNWLYEQLEFHEDTGEGCKARARLLLVDACRKDPDSRIRRNTNGPELASLTKPQLTEPPKGVVALFSCAAGQEALEHDPLQHGVFFYHVLEGLRGKADGDMDQQITLDEVIAFTKSKTTSYVRTELAAPQTPRQKGYFDGTWILRSLEGTSLQMTDSSRQMTNSIGMVLLPIPAGTFTMGSPDTEKDREDVETQHQITLSKSFYMGRTEVTRGQWKKVMGTEPWKGRDYVQEGDDYPAVYVSWNDAVAFCKKLSDMEGKTYRLPTEAEWEYACRGGTKTAFSFGDDEAKLSDYAWWGGILARGSVQDEKYAHRVAQKLPNPFGLHDMHGNVWEWCSDWFGNYPSTPLRDPQGPDSGSFRVLRGGSWLNEPNLVRCADRYDDTPGRRDSSYGFRLVLE